MLAEPSGFNTSAYFNVMLVPAAAPTGSFNEATPAMFCPKSKMYAGGAAGGAAVQPEATIASFSAPAQREAPKRAAVAGTVHSVLPRHRFSTAAIAVAAGASHAAATAAPHDVPQSSQLKGWAGASANWRTPSPITRMWPQALAPHGLVTQDFTKCRVVLVGSIQKMQPSTYFGSAQLPLPKLPPANQPAFRMR